MFSSLLFLVSNVHATTLASPQTPTRQGAKTSMNVPQTMAAVESTNASIIMEASRAYVNLDINLTRRKLNSPTLNKLQDIDTIQLSGLKTDCVSPLFLPTLLSPRLSSTSFVKGRGNGGWGVIRVAILVITLFYGGSDSECTTWHSCKL